MLVRIVRSLTPEEVYRRICRYEEQYDLVFDKFEDRFLKQNRPRHLLSAYLEWAGLVDAYRGYEEEGELDYIVEEIRKFDSRKLALLTRKRVELLNHLANTRVESINELAHKIKRDIKNVYDDLIALKRLGLVAFKRRGKRNVVPETWVEEITFLIR